jgi:hypothetical protein
MITVISDTERYSSSTGLVIETIAQYPVVYLFCQKAVLRSEDLLIVVRVPIVFAWLKNMSLRFPKGSFSFDVMDARLALSQKWGVEVPAEVDSQQILDAGLLQLDTVNPSGKPFHDVILEFYLGPLFTTTAFPYAQVNELIKAASPEKRAHLRSNPLVLRTFEKKVSAWLQTAVMPEQKWLIQAFAEDPPALQTLLTKFLLLRTYPGISETVLGNVLPALKALNLSLEGLPIDEAKNKEVINQILYNLNNIPADSPEAIGELINGTSGKLWAEFEFCLGTLLSKPEAINNNLVDQLETHFISLGKRIKEPIKKLRESIMPPKPTSPDPTWDAKTMLEWATNEYLPYQDWCASQGRFDSKLWEIGDVFSVWLHSLWPDLRANSERMIFNILPNIGGRLASDAKIHLVLVIDNLGWEMAKMATEFFQEHKYYLTTSDAYIAALPSETEISKKCLLSGANGYTTMEQNSYKGILEQGWLPYFGTANKFRYLSDISKLKQIDTIEDRVYVVNYLAIDRALHKSENELGFEHRKHIRTLLQNVAELVDEFIQKHTLTESIQVHIVSDHGSTQIPASAANALSPAFFDQPGFTAKSHRFIEVTNEKFSLLADNLKLDAFFLPANEFSLPAHVLCARGCNRFSGVDKDVFVHGGLLPEEVIVPFLTFEPSTTPIQPLEVQCSKSELRYRKESVELLLGNPNKVVVEKIRVSILNGNVEGEFETAPLVNAISQIPMKADLRFKQTNNPEDLNFLRLRLRYFIRGEMKTVDVRVPIKMRKMVEQVNNDIFD